MNVWSLCLSVWLLLLTQLQCCDRVMSIISIQEKRFYKEKVREMFFHAYYAYMDHAYPADELMPLTCKGRIRGQDKGRGDIDDALGRFSLTLIDTLDTLAVMGEVDEFNSAITTVIRDVSFNNDVIVSVFETNIRVLGGLLGGHFAAVELKRKGYNQLNWYDGELLTMAEELGRRLLPAFNTSTGLPYPKINLRHGMGFLNSDKTTCTACAGTLLLEFAALSKLTGDPDFEVKAHRAMQVLWESRTHNLMGTTINIHNGQWTRADSGVGAGIDSYYEYCLKSYVLFGHHEYLHRFEKHYDAIKRYISNGPLLVDVSMKSPTRMTRSFMDSLLAFWPGLQVLWGDIDAAIHTHDMLYHVTERHNFLPEAFTLDFRVHWGNHPLRPEFIESTYYLYKATCDSYYLDVGKTVLENLDKFARVSCGFAAIKNLKTNDHEDRMDSYVLAETFKYLFLLFAEDDELPLDMDDFVFTTEAHLIPLSLAYYNTTLNRVVQDALVMVNAKNTSESPDTPNVTTNLQPPTVLPPLSNSSPPSPSPPPSTTTPNNDHPQSHQPQQQTGTTHPVKDSLVMTVSLQCRNELRPYLLLDQYEKVMLKQCTCSRFKKRPEKPKSNKQLAPPRLTVDTLNFGNVEHLAILKDMGIMVEGMPGGRVQVSHLMQNAKSPEDAEEGWYLMQDIMRIMGQQQNADGTPKRLAKMVRILKPDMNEDEKEFIVGPALFGPDLGDKEFQVGAELVEVEPLDGCMEHPEEVADKMKGKIVLMTRGGCLFVKKVRIAQRAGSAGVIVTDNLESSNSSSSLKTPLPFSMSGDGIDDVTIPAVFMQKSDADVLRELLANDYSVYVLLTWIPEEQKAEESKDGALNLNSEDAESDSYCATSDCTENINDDKLSNSLFDDGT